MRATSPKQEDTSGNIRVVCRFRPLNSRELSETSETCIKIDGATVSVLSDEDDIQKFTLDAVFPPDSTQSAVYDFAAKPTVESVLEGFNGTVFAYGQTGSGKTFTMTGPDVCDSELKGVIPRMVATVFQAIESSGSDMEFTVKVAYAEIYMERLKDLLDPRNTGLQIHEDKRRGVYIAGITEEYVSSEAEVFALMKVGASNREVGATLMNEGSSRSHALFLLTISQTNKVDFSAKTGKLYLVDLAGSEKVGKTGAEGKRLDEAKTINKSLSALGLVITSLTDGKSTHVPYRDSKLTRVLQDSLGGNSKTCLIITCSPSTFNEMETVSTLRFGTRAKSIKNKPKINREVTVAELKLLLATAEAEVVKRDNVIFTLRKMLADAGGGVPSEEELAERRLEEDKAELESAVALEELKIELESLREETEALRRDKAAALEELRVETELRETAIAGSEESEAKCASMSSRMTTMQGQLEGRDEEISRLNQRMRELQQEASEARAQLSECEENAQRVQRELLEQSIHVKSLKMEEVAEEQAKEIQSLKEKLGILEEEVAKRKRKDEAEVAAQRTSEEEREKSRQMAQEITALHERNATLESQRESLTLEAQDYTAQKQQIISENTALKEKLASMEKSIFTEFSSIRSIRVPTKEQQLLAEVEALRTKIASSDSEKVALKAEINRRHSPSLTAEVSKLRTQLQEMEETKRMLSRDLCDRVEKVVQLEMEIDQMKETNSMLLEVMSGGDKALQKHVYWLEAEVRRLNLQSNRRLKDISRLSGEVSFLELENIKLKDRLAEAEVNLKAAISMLDGMWEKKRREESERDSTFAFRSMCSLKPNRVKKVIRGGTREFVSMPSEESDAE